MEAIELKEEFQWPPDYLEVFRARARLLTVLQSDGKKLRAVRQHYMNSYADFINDWFMTYDPRDVDMPHKPFVLKPKQRDFIDWLQHEILPEQQDALVEKSRDEGATVLTCAFAICHSMFRKGQKIGFGSRKEKLVDELGNPDSIFEKIRYMIKTLPPLFRPDTGDFFCKISFKETGSTIIGEAGDQIGRGGRSTMYFKDESAFYERPERIEAALSENSNVKIDISTPNGTGNPFAQKRFSGNYPVFTFHWRDNPAKDEEWYNDRKRKLDPVVVAQEIDIDYQASVENLCIDPAWVEAAIDFPIEPSGVRKMGYDVGDGGDANCTVSRHGVVVKMNDIEVWGENDKKQNTTDNARKVYADCRDRKIKSMVYDSIGIGSGIRGEIISLQRTATVKIECIPLNVGSTDLPGMWDQDHPNSDMFVNLKAFLWWNVRRRFYRTWERVNGYHNWPDEDCISIPNHPQLKKELSTPMTEPRGNGKYEIESKKSLKRRGVKSPNVAEAFVLCFSPLEEFEVGTW